MVRQGTPRAAFEGQLGQGSADSRSISPAIIACLYDWTKEAEATFSTCQPENNGRWGLV